MRWWVAWFVAVWVVAGAALATSGDPRGWTEGKVAANVAKITGPAFDTTVELTFPPPLAKQIEGVALVVYVSPTCPHCRHVAPEIAALAARLAGRATVVGVAAGSSDPDAVDEFRTTFGWTFPVLIDRTRAMAQALGARSTPSAVLVRRVGERFEALDAWYPYGPGADVLVEMRVAGNPFAALADRPYLGSRACGACHTQELASWALTHHSVAWSTLQRTGDDTNPACVGCHVTGKGAPGGWAPGEDTLVDVGCEACHGPAGPHDGTRTDAASTCEGCHDAKHSLDFRYARAVPLIDHFRSEALDDAAYEAARRELLAGRAPRELMTFSEGAYVGSAACAGCHPAEQTHWAASRHGHAMASLTAQGRGDQLACVPCHAVAKTPGPPPSTVDGYRTDEGVGCEGCHGPGQAHVDAKGGTDNIVGLGESCPVCVIEAVCTRCHTDAWDPDWDLTTDLGRVRHGGAAASE